MTHGNIFLVLSVIGFFCTVAHRLMRDCTVIKLHINFPIALPSRKININFKPHPLSLPLYHCYFALVMTEWLQCDKESNFKCLRKTEKVTDLVLYCRKEQKQLDVSDNGTIQPLTKFFHKFAIRMASYRSKCTLHASLCAIKLDRRSMICKSPATLMITAGFKDNGADF